MEKLLNTFVGLLLFSSVIASLGNGFFSFSVLPAGALQVAAVVLLWPQVPITVRWQSFFLVVLGVLALKVADVAPATLLEAFYKNQSIIAMLAGVGFLRFVPKPEAIEHLPSGRRALWQTLFSVHWLGAFVNISAVVLFGDRIRGEKRQLSIDQGFVLTRGFALAALWSPFFVAMGVAINNAPGARIPSLLLWGLPFSQMLLVVLAWYMSRPGNGATSFYGYPVAPQTLLGPIMLVVAVIIAHSLEPKVPIVSLITLMAPIYVFIVIRKERKFKAFSQYLFQDLPRMGSEVTLFLAAGVLGVGATALVPQGIVPFSVDGKEFLMVVIGLAIIVAVAATGVHPVAGISVVGAALGPMGIRPDLMAMSFLMGWSLGVIINPISGLNILLSGRYGFSSRQIWRWNAALVACGYGACCGWLYIFDRFS